jgi:hypothetical protein
MDAKDMTIMSTDPRPMSALEQLSKRIEVAQVAQVAATRAEPTAGKPPMTTLERLAAKVHEMEVRAKSSKISTDLTARIDTLRIAYEAFAAALATAAAIDSTIPDQIAAEDGELRKMKSTLAKFATKEERDESGPLIVIAEDELKEKRRTYERSVERATLAKASTYEEASRAATEYRRMRVSYDKLLPGETEKMESVIHAERMVAFLEMQTPWGAFCKLRQEVADVEPHFPQIPRGGTGQQDNVHFYTLRIWVATLRQIQMAFEKLTDEQTNDQERYEVRKFYGTLVGISKRYMPGFDETFQEGFKGDWEALIADARANIVRINNDLHRS